MKNFILINTIVVGLLNIAVTSPAFALDESAFKCVSMNYWLTKAAIGKPNMLESIARACSLPVDQNATDIIEFIDTADAGDPWFFGQVYGQARLDEFKAITKEAKIVIDLTDAVIIKAVPLPDK